MLLNRQLRFPLVLQSLLHCIPLRVVRLFLLKNVFLPLISFRRRSHFECICYITDATKTLTAVEATVTAAGIELSEVDVFAFKVEAEQQQFGTQVSGSRRWEMLGKCLGGLAEGTELLLV